MTTSLRSIYNLQSTINLFLLFINMQINKYSHILFYICNFNHLQEQYIVKYIKWKLINTNENYKHIYTHFNKCDYKLLIYNIRHWWFGFL